jgi:hypothetical protein
MRQGTNWEGDYSRFTYDETKRYALMLKEQGVPVLDDEFNLLQEVLLTFFRRFVVDSGGSGVTNGGFKVVGTGASNDFTIKGGDGTLDGAGRIYVNGWPILLESDTTYSGQEKPGDSLTTPSKARTDEVYIDVYFDEVGPASDGEIKDPVIGEETSRRLKLYYQVLVSEGSVTPSDYVDASNRQHWTYHLATLARTAQAAIDANMVTDKRTVLGAQWAKVNGDSAERFSVANATSAANAVNKGQADAAYARLSKANTFTETQTAPDFVTSNNSDPRLKEAIEPYRPDWDTLMKIALYSWRWREDGTASVGAMAPEVRRAVPELAHLDGEGNPTGVQYGQLGFVLARRCMEEVDSLRDKIVSLNAQINSLHSMI